MSKVRINDLARELEVKSKSILDALTAVGVTEPKTHSSSIEAAEAEKVRNYLSGKRGSSSAAAKPQVEAKPAFNLAHISKPGDAVKAILARKQAEEEARRAPRRPAATPAPPTAVSAPKAATKPAKESAPAVAATAAPAPRRVVPQPRQHAQIVTPPQPPPAIASKPPVGPVIGRPPVVVAPPPSAHATPAQPAAAHAAAGRLSAAAASLEVPAPPATVKRVKRAALPVAGAPAATPAAATTPVAATSAASLDASSMAAAEHKADGADRRPLKRRLPLLPRLQPGAW